MRADVTLRAARRSSGLTLRRLAERAGTSHATLASYEAGRKIPTVATLDRILRAAGVEAAIDLTPRVGGADRADRGRELEQVLHLAAQFPARHAPTLVAPVFGRR